MFLFWLNITVSTVVDVVWYLVFYPPPPMNLYLSVHPHRPKHAGHTAQKSPSSHKSSSPKPSPSSPPPQSITAGRPISPLFALVIGIDKYKHHSHELIDLHGAVADADAVTKFLHEILHVPEHRIKNLRNEKATRVTIETEIENLGNNPAIKKDDPILIFYAGHGAEANAPSGWHSANGKMQMLVPYDFIPGGSSDSQRGQGVLDARLSRLLADLAAKKSDNITVILDCCHSGSGTRTNNNDPTSTVRGFQLPVTYTIPKDLLRGIKPDVPHRASVVTKGFEKSGLSSHVLLSACKAEQSAWEKGQRGAFTSALLSLLRTNGVDKLTYKDVITNMHDLSAQDPQCEGVHQSRRLFNSKVPSPHRELYPIRASDPKIPDQYDLDAGEAHGITKEAEFVVFADRTMESTLGTVVAVKTTAFTTTCCFFPRGDKKQSFTLAKDGYALQTRVGEGQDIRLLVELDEKLLGVFERIADEMQSSKARKRGFRLVDSRDDEPDLVIAADGDKVHFEIMEKDCIDHGLTRMPFEVNINDSDAIHRILRSSADFYWHLHRSIKGSPLAGKVKLKCMKLTGTGEYTDDLEEILKPDPNGGNLNIGGVISVDVNEEAMYGFKIENTSAVPLYVSMFYFDASDLSIAAYYQPGSARDGAVDFSLPPKKSLTIGYGASGTVPHNYTLRKGQDVDVGFLKLFFSTEYMDLSGIVQESPFDDRRKSETPSGKKRGLWHAMRITVVQKKGGDVP
ncbi:caspase domain-containing protein [Desarmillaria tabescens]|uniref:Caspase domain-containing protein n=1 Tax=Armillaria tabescens TaxID=1929756 RepID=A0AA39K219_ARMTA|nr:caspase domain-containing protein [Desarmillaria tabescens]KAK0452948.1 caspase domain-containing protein [Desarmillaria tabescens]